MTAISRAGPKLKPAGSLAQKARSVAKHRRLDGREIHRDAPGDDTAARLEQARPDVGNGLDEAGFEPELSDLVADENVGAFREVGVGGVREDELHAILEPVGTRQVARQPDDGSGLDAVDARGAGSAGEQAENAGAGGQVNDHVAGPDGRGDRTGEGVNARPVADELAMRVQFERHVRLRGSS